MCPQSESFLKFFGTEYEETINFPQRRRSAPLWPGGAPFDTEGEALIIVCRLLFRNGCKEAVR